MWNRSATLIVLVTATTLLITPNEIEARGGGRGGGGGGGGRSGGGASRSGGNANRSGGSRASNVYTGGNVMNRTPTMSRASSQPVASRATPQIQNRPSVAQGRTQQARQTVQQRPSAANRSDLRNQVNQYAQSRPTQNIDTQAFAKNAQNFSNKRSSQVAQNRQLSDNVSQRVQQTRPGSSQWFNQNFFNQHNVGADYARSGANLWRPAAWAAVANWGDWNWSTPYYYDDGGYTYPVTPTESSYAYPYDATTTPSQSVQTEPLQSTAKVGEEWLPLGVFAVATNANTAPQTNRFIQLALNRSGEIAGVLYNSATDAAQDLTGMVDPNTQQAYWSMANKTNSPIASTGIYNLTEDQTPVNVHFADGTDQIWTLVRLQEGK